MVGMSSGEVMLARLIQQEDASQWTTGVRQGHMVHE